MTGNQFAPAMPKFLAQGGDMAARIHALDWRETQLGAIETWPNSLKCAISTILGSPRPMCVLWGSDLLYFFNDAYVLMLGNRLDDAMGRPFAQVWPELSANFEPMLRQALGGHGCSHENMPLTLVRHGYPEPTWWTFSYLPLRNEHGEVVGVHCVSMETTELVQLQRMLLVKQKHQAFWIELIDALRGCRDPHALRAIAAQKLGNFLQLSCVGYGEIDEAGQHCVVRQDWTTGGFPGVVGTHRLDDFGPVMAQQLRAGQTVAVSNIEHDHRTASEACLTAHQATGKKAFIDAPLVKDGRLAALLFVLSATPRVWTDSEQTLVEEVAERTWSSLQRLQAELDLRQTNQALAERTTELLRSDNALRQSQKLEAMGQLTGGVAHDFNNLLAVISASVELLRSSALPADQRSYYLDRIFNTVARGVKLTGQLLAFARQQPLKPEVFNVDVHVKNLLDLLRPLISRQIEIVYEPCGSNTCFANADINQFETALVNLTVNARDAMSASGRLVINVQAVDSVPASPARAKRPGAFIAISVSDTGCGIAPDKLESIFEPFYTTKEVGKGTGLGLSQVFGFAKQSGGEIAVSSELGAGSVFTLYMARADSGPLLEALAAPAARLDARAQGPASKSGVLIVEDNETLAGMTCELLNALGYRAVWVASAAAALDLLASESGSFDVVFSDVVMPGMNGVEFGKEVRLRYPGLPIVLTSGYNAVMPREGQCEFEMVLKPYTSGILVRAFDKALAAQS